MMVHAEGARTRALTRNGLIVSWTDISIYRMSPEYRNPVYFATNQYVAQHEISPLLPTLTSPFLIYNSERLQNVSY